MLGDAGAAASAPPRCGKPAPGDFTSLLDRARAAHHVEIEDLRLEVLGLRRELLAVRGQLDQQLGASVHASNAVDGPREARDTPAGDSGHISLEGPQRMDTENSIETTSSWASAASEAPSRSGTPSTKVRGLRHSAPRRQASRIRLVNEKGCLWAFVTSLHFEATIMVLILANAMVLALEAQYRGFSLATSTGHASAVGESAEVWPLGEDAFKVLSWMFGVMFSLEFVLKVVGLRLEFFKCLWNCLDAAVVLLWVCSELTALGMNAAFLRILRVARLVRLVRLLKILKSNRSDGLFLMATSLTGTISSTTWCFIFLIIVHILLALGMNQFLHEAYFDSSSPDTYDQAAMYEYFGSFSRSFLTMLEITWGNFIVPVRALTEHVNEAFILYAMCHKILLGFAVLGVLNALFVQETFKAASLDDNLMVRQQRAKMAYHRRKMTELFEEADLDGNGTLDMDEWLAVCQDEWVQAWLASQELKTEDASSLFELIDDGDGRLTAEEIVKGTSSLKGTSATMKVIAMMYRIHNSVKDIRSELLFSQPDVAAERM